MQLGKVPNMTHELSIKTTSNGIVYLKTSKFKSRYTGNKYSAVDINGNLWLKRSEYEKSIRGDVPKKKPLLKTTGGKKNSCGFHSEQEQSSDILSTDPGNLLTNEIELSTQKEYRVNGSVVRQRILAFLNSQAGKKELYFWTVTFPQGLPDESAYKVYNIWLTTLRQYKMLKNYLWIAERQQNGTIHFHIAIPHRMSVKKANAMMRGTLINAARRKDIDCNVHLLRRYNGVDIAKNRKTKRVTNFALKKGSRSLANYLTKYVTKNNGSFSHLAWHNSRGYSGIFLGVTFTTSEFLRMGYHHHIDREKQFSNEHFVFVPWNSNGPPRKIMDHLFELNSWVQSQLN